MNKPNCYECKHRGTLVGNTHSRCLHPKVKTDIASELFSIMGVGNIGAGVIEAALELDVKANPHGVKNGWAFWPYNFDPIWITNCKGFEKKDG